MTDRPLIAVLAGAHATQHAVQWLQQAGARGCVLWSSEADPKPLDLPVCDAIPPDTRAILDATHPFDEGTRVLAHKAAPAARYARIGHDPWQPEPGDAWRQVATLDAAIAALPPKARVFAATGRSSLPMLSAHDGHVFLRQLTQHGLATGYDNCDYVFGSPPFAVTEEVALFKELEIDVLLARNIGGTGSFPKLAAARELELPAILLSPPARPDGPHLRTAQQLADWIDTI